MTSDEARSVEAAAQEHLEKAETHYRAMVREKHRAVNLWVTAAKRVADRAAQFRLWSSAARVVAELPNRNNRELTEEYVRNAINVAPSREAITELERLVKR